MLKSNKDSLQIRKNSLSKRLKFLSAITDFNLGKANKQLSEESFGVEDWKGILDFIEGENNRIKSSISGLGKELAAVEEQINEVSGKIRMMNIDKSGKEVVIDCEVKSAGVLTFRITYLTGETAWRP